MSFMEIEVRGRVALMTLNSPDTRNALSGTEHYDAVEQACATLGANRSLGAVILTGAGTAFCAGGDVKKMWARVSAPDALPIDERYRYKEGIHRIVTALYNLELPVIAAINGPAIGAGLDLACMCDIRIASERARFAESFVKLGIIPGDGGAWLLQKIVGPSRAAEMIFTGQTIDTQQALAYGLISQVVAADRLLDAAFELAERIAENPPHALRMAKRLLREAQHARLESVLEMSAAFQALAHFTNEHKTLVQSAATRSQAK